MEADQAWPDVDEAFVDVVAAIERSVQAARQQAWPGAPSPPRRAPLQRAPGTVFRDLEAPWCPELGVSRPALRQGSPEMRRGDRTRSRSMGEVRAAFALGGIR
jgi:hypothetical protein